MPSREEQARDDAKSTEEFLAEHEAKHGPAAARIIAKSLGLPPPRQGVKPHQATRAGVPRSKQRKGPPLTAKYVEGSSIPRGLSWKDAGDPPVRVKIGVMGRWSLSCDACTVAFAPGEEFVRLDNRIGNRPEWFHPQCCPEVREESP